MTAKETLEAVLQRYNTEERKLYTRARDYKEAQYLAGRLGKTLGEIIVEELLEAYPDGIVTEADALTIIPPALRRNAQVVAGVTKALQVRLNRAAGVAAAAPDVEFDEERARGIAVYVSSCGSIEEHQDAVVGEVENNSKSTVDDAVSEQAEIHAEMGLSPKIVRTAAPGCCEWCNKLAGTYDYSPNMDRDVYLRHVGCECLIEYDPGDGAKKRVNNYRYSQKLTPQERIANARKGME